MFIDLNPVLFKLKLKRNDCTSPVLTTCVQHRSLEGMEGGQLTKLHQVKFSSSVFNWRECEELETKLNLISLPYFYIHLRAKKIIPLVKNRIPNPKGCFMMICSFSKKLTGP